MMTLATVITQLLNAKFSKEKHQKKEEEQKTYYDHDSNVDFIADTGVHFYCNDLFSRTKPSECWLQSTTCSRRAHAACTDVPKTTIFVCELCV